MFARTVVFDNHEMMLVSKRAVFAFIGFLLSLTILLVTVFLITDFDYILGRKTLAMKIGQTSISLADLKLIQKISGVKAQRLPENTFAADFFETALLAEAGRISGLDQKPDFISKIKSFDSAVKIGKENETIAKAVFLLEELAEATRQQIMEDYNYSSELAAAQKPVATAKPRLHLRTILTETPEIAQLIVSEKLAGRNFDELNASWSRSLYKSLGGDIGWKTATDFPDHVFAGLQSLEPGILAEAFTDEAGTHLFEIVSKPKVDLALAEKAAREQTLRELKRRRLSQYIAELKNKITYWVNPILQNRCQVVSTTGSPETKRNYQGVSNE